MFKLKVKNSTTMQLSKHIWGLMALSMLFGVRPNIGQVKKPLMRVGYPGVKAHRAARKIRNNLASQSRRINR